MADQKNPTNAGSTSSKAQQDQQRKPQDGDRVGGDASRTKASGKPEDKNTKQPGRETKPEVMAKKK